MKKLKVFLVVLLIIVSIVLLVSCQKTVGNGSSKNSGKAESETNKGLPVKLANPDFTFLYTQDPPNPTVLKTTQMYEEKYGGKVKFETVVWGEKNNKLATMISAGDAPDLFVINHTDLPLLAMRESIQPLDGYIDFDDPIWDKDLLMQLSYKGKIYGANNELSVFVIFYNEDMFYNNGLKTPKEYYKEGKWTWEALKEVAIKLTQDIDNNGTIDQYGLLYNNRTIPCFIGTNDTDFVKTKEDGSIELQLSDSKLVDALRFIQDSYGAVPFQYSGSAAQPMFMDGKGGMIIDRKVGIRDTYTPGACAFKWEIAPFPVGPSGQPDYVPAEVALWAIPTGAKNPEAAAAWMNIWRVRDNAEGDPSVMQSLTPEHIELFKKLESQKKAVAKFFGAGLRAPVNQLHNEIKKGTPIITLLEQNVPKFQNEIDNLTK